MPADYAVLVMALRVGRTWGEVAALCNGRYLSHPGSYYQRIATGKIKTPHLAARNGIDKGALVCGLTAVKRTSPRVCPLGVSISRPLGLRVNQWRRAHSMTWNQWHEKADRLMRREYGEEAPPSGFMEDGAWWPAEARKPGVVYDSD